MAETDLLYYEPGYLYTDASHTQEPAASGPLQNGCVRVRILLLEFVQPYEFLRGSSSSSPRVLLYPEYPRRSREVSFVAPLNELLRLHQMPPDSAVLDSVNCAMEIMGNLHPDVERTVLSLVQERCNSLIGERPVGPISSPSSSTETVITVNAEWHTRELVLGEEHMMNAMLGESFEEACGSVIRAAKEEAVEKLERFVVDDEEDDDDEDNRERCTVCMDYMEPGDRVARMPCEHVYHADCIVEWLGVSCSCPICRFELPSDHDDQDRVVT